MTRFSRRTPARSCLLFLALAGAACGPDAKQSSTTLPVTRLSPESADQYVASWSPDGRRVAYLATTPEGAQLQIAGPDLADPHPVTLVGNFGGVAVWSPDGAMLAYSSGAEGSADVWVVQADGSGARRLTTGEGVEFPFAWHPSGSRLAYIHTSAKGQIQCSVVDLATGASTSQVEGMPDSCGMWSPDGTRLAFSPVKAGGSTFWVADADGRNPRQLTHEGFERPHDDFMQSWWSPDGREILYISERTGRSDLWVVPVDSGAPRQLTRDLRNDWNGTWSPDGQQIAFLSVRGGQTDVWVVPAAGGTERRITDDPAIESYVQWLGDSVVGFTASRPTSSLWSFDPATGAEHRLTPEGERAESPVPSPDGTELVYSVNRGGGIMDLYRMPGGGGESKPVVAGNGWNGWARWSPDGRTIAFASDRAGLGDIWTVPAAGGEPSRITESPGSAGNPQWSADGTSLYFMAWGTDSSQLGDVRKVPAAGGASRPVTSLGNASRFWMQPARDELYVFDWSGPGGRSRLVAVAGEGATPRVVWDRSAVMDVTLQSFSPSGDTIALAVDEGAAGAVTQLVPIAGGEGRRISVGRNTWPGAWSPAGNPLAVLAVREGRLTEDLALVNLTDGSSRWLTDSPERECCARWVLGGKQLVFVRTDDRSWIARAPVPAGE